MAPGAPDPTMPGMASTRLPVRLAGALAAFLAAGAVSAAGAQAGTYCVLAPGCAGTDVDGLQQALDLAAGAAGDDRVELGPGTFTSPIAFSYLGAATGGALELVGAGPGTVVAADAPSKPGLFTALTLQGGEQAVVQVRGMRIVAPTRADAQSNTQGLALQRATGDGSGVRLEDSDVSGGTTGVLVKTDGNVQITRTRVDATGGGVAAVRCAGCAGLELCSAVLRIAGTTAGIRAEGSSNAAAIVDASHLTIAGTGSDGTVAVQAVAQSSPYAAATVRLDDCILDRVGSALAATAPPFSGNPASIAAIRCNYDPSGTTRSRVWRRASA